METGRLSHPNTSQTPWISESRMEEVVVLGREDQSGASLRMEGK